MAKRLFSVLILFFIALCLFPFSARVFGTSADTSTSVNTDMFAPASYLEYFDLSSPQDVYMDEEITAIIDNYSRGKRIVIYKDGVYSVYADGIGDIIQIARYENYLIVQDNAALKCFNLETEEYSNLLADGLVISCNYFALNSEYLVTVTNNTLNVFSINLEEGLFSLSAINSTTGGSMRCVAINDDNDIFYFQLGSDNNDASSQRSLYVSNVENLSTSTRLCEIYIEQNCTSMVATSGFVYYLYGGSENWAIGYVDVSSGTTNCLIEKTTEEKLGNLIAPMGLSLSKGNLLVCDRTLNAVERFYLDGTTATYDGFSITGAIKGDNRITSSVSLISLNDGTLCAYGDNEIKLFSTKNTDCKNFSVDFSAEYMCLGNKHVLLATQNAILFINTLNGVATEFNEFSAPNVKSVFYSNGYFYLLVSPNGNQNEIIKISETDISSSEIAVSLDDITGLNNGDMLAVDVDGNIFVYSGYENAVIEYSEKTGERVYAYNDDGGNITGSERISVDINGNVYLLKNGILTKLKNASTEYEIYSLNISENLIGPFTYGESAKTFEVKNFAMNFDSNEIYFLIGNLSDALIIKSTKLNNMDVYDYVPQELNLTSTSSTEELSVVGIDAGVNLYEIKVSDDGLLYNGFFKNPEYKEYVLISDGDEFITVSDGKLLLVKKVQTTEIETDVTENEFTGYVTTSVNAYYFPIMTRNGEYILEGFSRLSAGDSVAVKSTLKINNEYFYYAEINTENGEVYGYIPTAFVSDKIATDRIFTSFKIKSLIASEKTPVKIYSDSDMQNEIATATENSKIKVYKIENGKALIEISLDGETFTGYVNSSAIVNQKNHTLRNALIITIILVAAFTTSLFFVMKKKY